MTALQARVREVHGGEIDAVRRALAADPVGTCVFAARFETVCSVRMLDLGAPLLGVGDGTDLRTLCYAGGNILPLGGAPEDFTRLGAEIVRQRRAWSSVVGRRESVLAMWESMSAGGAHAREVRADQPVLVTRTAPADDGRSGVGVVGLNELESYLPAAVAMFSEELHTGAPDISRHSPYRRRVRQLVDNGMAFARFGDDGQVLFKAEIAAVSSQCSQVQGVWVHPAHRGQGIATSAMAFVLGRALQLAPMVSLYVNDYNVPARRLYARLGLVEDGRFATVLA